jgi:hypothetical protein
VPSVWSDTSPRPCGEAKDQTSHVDPDLDYEPEGPQLGRWALAAGPCRDVLEGWLKDIAGLRPGHTLAAKLVQLTLPESPMSTRV